MVQNIEETVKLPEALVGHLGPMIVRYAGWEENDPQDAESNKLHCDVVWRGRRYACPLLLPLQGIVFDSQLTEDCRKLLSESVEHESELEFRAQYLGKIEGVVQRAAVRLYKSMLKSKKLPGDLRPKKRRAK